MRETRSSGSVRGASGDGCPYRESTPAAYPRRDERRDSPRKPGVQGGRGELLNRVETGSLSAGQLLDDLVGAGEQRVRQREAGRTSGL
jgi:hypothetical protein